MRGPRRERANSNELFAAQRLFAGVRKVDLSRSNAFCHTRDKGCNQGGAHHEYYPHSHKVKLEGHRLTLGAHRHLLARTQVDQQEKSVDSNAASGKAQYHQARKNGRADCEQHEQIGDKWIADATGLS